MALYVNTNISSINAQRKLSNATLNLNTSYQRLSSGLRINSAKDDAAGLMIADRLTAQINGLNQGNRNANDGIALAQTVEGAMDETTNMLQRIRTLAVQAANGTNTNEDRKSIQDEVTQLCAEISRIAVKTTFGGAQILDGTPGGGANDPVSLLDTDGHISFQVGANAYDSLDLDLSSGFKLSCVMSEGTNSAHANNRIANSVTAPADIAKAWNDFLANTTTGIIQTQDAAGNWATARFSVTSQDLAQKTLALIDQGIKYVDSKRSALGALQNRMESTIRNQSSISENSSDARSRIRDTDFAAETAALTQNNIIQNASQSILAQANQRPTVALQLLG